VDDAAYKENDEFGRRRRQVGLRVLVDGTAGDGETGSAKRSHRGTRGAGANKVAAADEPPRFAFRPLPAAGLGGTRQRMARLRWLLAALAVLALAGVAMGAMYEDQAGLFDWYGCGRATLRAR